MKLFWWSLVLAVLTGAGCVDSNLLHLGRPAPAPKKEAPIVPLAAPPRMVPPVTADQVTPHNYQAKVQALRDELDQAECPCPANPASSDCQACASGHH